MSRPSDRASDRLDILKAATSQSSSGGRADNAGVVQDLPSVIGAAGPLGIKLEVVKASTENEIDAASRRRYAACVGTGRQCVWRECQAIRRAGSAAPGAPQRRAQAGRRVSD